jgi:hypothetical protein
MYEAWCEQYAQELAAFRATAGQLGLGGATAQALEQYIFRSRTAPLLLARE